MWQDGPVSTSFHLQLRAEFPHFASGEMKELRIRSTFMDRPGRQGKDPLGLLDIAQWVAPEIDQGLIDLPRQGARDEHRLVQALGQIQEPAGPVHGRADHREIQPVRGPDIAIGHLADMQRQAVGQGRAARGAQNVLGFGPPAERLRGRERLPAGGRAARPPEVGKMASTASPMNLSTSPPCASTTSP